MLAFCRSLIGLAIRRRPCNMANFGAKTNKQKKGNTWRLLHTVLKDNFGEQEPMPDDLTELTDKMIVDRKFKADSNLRQSQYVVEWLEEIAKFEFDEFIDARNYESADVCWHSTMESIQASRRGRVDEDLSVTTMDPDAPMRSGGRLDSQDEDDERRLMRKVFALLRIGDFDRVNQRWLECMGAPPGGCGAHVPGVVSH